MSDELSCSRLVRVRVGARARARAVVRAVIRVRARASSWVGPP